jgi:hypothetical protein
VLQHAAPKKGCFASIATALAIVLVTFGLIRKAIR